MRRLILIAAGAALWLLVACSALAAGERDPLQVPLKHYAVMLGAALLGGFVSWYGRVRSGKAVVSVFNLVGELATSAFAGLLAFWACQAAEIGLNYTIVAVAVSGHMGTRAIALAELRLQKRLGLLDEGKKGESGG
jgi:hypothetical protein